MNRWLLAMLALLVASCCAAQGAPSPAGLSPAEVTARSSEVSEAIATAKRCAWTTPLYVQALELYRAEAEAQVSEVSKDAATAFTNGIVQGELAAPRHSCSDEALKGQLLNIANTFTAVTMVRAKAILDAEAVSHFGKSETTLDAYAAAVGSMDATVRQQAGAQYTGLRTQQDEVAKAGLVLLCDERKTIRATPIRLCPAPTADQSAHAASIKAMIVSSEKLVAAYVATVASATATPAAPTAPVAARAAGKSPEGFTIYESATGLAKFGDASDYLYPDTHLYADRESPADCGYGMKTLHLADKDAVHLLSTKYAYVYAPMGPADGSAPLQWKLYGFEKADDGAPAVMSMYVLEDADSPALKAAVAAWKQAQGAKLDAAAAPYDQKLSSAINGKGQPTQMRRCGVKSNPGANYVTVASRNYRRAHLNEYFGMPAAGDTGNGPIACSASTLIVAPSSPGSVAVEGKTYRMYFTELSSLSDTPQWVMLAERKDTAPRPDGSRQLLYVKMEEKDVLGYAKLVRPNGQKGEIAEAARQAMISGIEARPLEATINGDLPKVWRKCQ